MAACYVSWQGPYLQHISFVLDDMRLCGGLLPDDKGPDGAEPAM